MAFALFLLHDSAKLSRRVEESEAESDSSSPGTVLVWLLVLAGLGLWLVARYKFELFATVRYSGVLGLLSLLFQDAVGHPGDYAKAFVAVAAAPAALTIYRLSTTIPSRHGEHAGTRAGFFGRLCFATLSFLGSVASIISVDFEKVGKWLGIG